LPQCHVIKTILFEQFLITYEQVLNLLISKLVCANKFLIARWISESSYSLLLMNMFIHTKATLKQYKNKITIKEKERKKQINDINDMA